MDKNYASNINQKEMFKSYTESFDISDLNSSEIRTNRVISNPLQCRIQEYLDTFEYMYF